MKKNIIVYKGRNYRIDSEGYYGCHCRKVNKYLRLHRVIWEENNGPMPPGMDIHHKNENKTDNRIENLAAIDHSKHPSVHARSKTKNCI